ncbi:polysaccharide biosynthesis protein [Mangrovihabitans endophyticus]|uniref:UDP-glucose 4-epimerase n=1 Tax=Mangrovihabitans endophyticus TaxID=1751298 RepID=A0A8J3C3E9_9ACTN|nr:polysaccharide biosynthesis protein [Mangrovihabitans endophyticus]GGL04428.1 UDP-glucose 4-epimerase [Mangrovihabitans endophyticus]
MLPSLTGQRFLVTGGTGSFGRTMVGRLLSAGADEVRVLSRDEAKQDDMRRRLRDDRVRFYVGDVRDADSVGKAVKDVTYVFHAAALKQVPSCEFFPLEAIRTNVIGSSNVIDACERHGVQSAVFLSTDKAVQPINAMGMSKALMEKVVQAHARNNPNAATNVSCVRYGNVMYSRGSVIPLFIEQIRAGEPLTVTEPRMTRFLMSLADSVDLVEHAFTRAAPGDIFIRKAPASTVADLGTALCNLFGVAPKMNILGIRHGEKMAETLASAQELAHAQDYGDFFRIPIDSRDLNYSLYFDEGETDRKPLFDFNSDNATRLTVSEVEDLLRTLPEIRAEVGVAQSDGQIR